MGSGGHGGGLVEYFDMNFIGRHLAVAIAASATALAAQAVAIRTQIYYKMGNYCETPRDDLSEEILNSNSIEEIISYLKEKIEDATVEQNDLFLPVYKRSSKLLQSHSQSHPNRYLRTNKRFYALYD